MHPQIPFFTFWFQLKRKEHKASSVCIIAIFLFKHYFYSGELLTRFLSIICNISIAVRQRKLLQKTSLSVSLKECHCVVPAPYKTFLDVCLGKCFQHFHPTSSICLHLNAHMHIK